MNGLWMGYEMLWVAVKDSDQSAFRYSWFVYCLSIHSNPKGQGTDGTDSFFWLSMRQSKNISSTSMDSRVPCGSGWLAVVKCINIIKHSHNEAWSNFEVLFYLFALIPMIWWYLMVPSPCHGHSPHLVAVPLGTARIRWPAGCRPSRPPVFPPMLGASNLGKFAEMETGTTQLDIHILV